ncbi:ankyrin repeat-containing domain protein, partial [Hysterangium stoloniferum]
IYNWLSAPDPSGNFNAAQEQCMANTGAWFLNSTKFIKWKEDVNQYLWIYGISGSGKTILCSSIIANIQNLCKNDSSYALAYFFFDSRDLQEAFQSHHYLLKSLIKQLVSVCFDIPKCLSQIYGNGIQQPSLKDLEKTLCELLTMFNQVYIILDALDESSEHGKVIKWLSKLLSQNSSRLHILVTTRPEVSIQRELDNLNPEHLFLHRQRGNNDITTYIYTKLQSKTIFSSKDENLLNNIFRTLNDRAEGMFRWVALQLEELSACLSDEELEKQLDTIPAGLFGSYRKIILKIPKKHAENALKFLQWLAFSLQPLKAKELAQITGINMDYVIGGSKPPFNSRAIYNNPTNILGICTGLVLQAEGEYCPICNKNSNRTIKLAHFSVKEYLMMDSSLGGPPPNLHLEKQVAHSHITKMCLIYLLQFQNTLMSSIKNQTDLEYDHPLARYSATQWVSHAQAGGCQPLEVYHNLIMKLFEQGSQQYEFWKQESWGKQPIPQLVIAAYHGLCKVSAVLLEGGVDPNIQTNSYGTALGSAATQGHLDVVQTLLAHGADPNVQGGSYGTALSGAAVKGHLDVVQALLAHGANPNVQGGSYRTALGGAAARGHLDVVQALLSHGANPNAQGVFDGTALGDAAAQGHLDMVQALLAHGADPNVQGGSYGTALGGAAAQGHLDVVQALLAHGANLNVQGGSYRTALGGAAAWGHLDVVQALLAHGADPNVQGGSYGEALSGAAAQGHLDVVQALLVHGADPNVQGDSYGTALGGAAAQGHLDVVQALLAHGTDPNVQGGSYGTALGDAAAQGHLDVVQALLAHDADPNVQGGSDGTGLGGAAARGHLDVVQALLAHGADPNVQGGFYGTGLGGAAAQGHLDVVQALLAHGANLNAQGGFYGTALGGAAAQGHLDMIQALLAHGADPNVQGGSHGTGLGGAAAQGHLDVVQALLAHGADPNVQRGSYGTALDGAAAQGHLDVVQALLAHSADPNVQGGSSRTALGAAVAWGHLDVAQALLDHGADLNAQWGLDGKTLSSSAAEGQLDVVQTLLDHGTV